MNTRCFNGMYHENKFETPVRFVCACGCVWTNHTETFSWDFTRSPWAELRGFCHLGWVKNKESLTFNICQYDYWKHNSASSVMYDTASTQNKKKYFWYFVSSPTVVLYVLSFKTVMYCPALSIHFLIRLKHWDFGRVGLHFQHTLTCMWLFPLA